MINPATSGVDYDPNVDAVILNATMSSGTFTLSTNVTLIDDAILEFSEEFTVFLNGANPPFGVMIDGMFTTTIVTLGDDGMLA